MPPAGVMHAGGSAYLLIDSNAVYNCREAGLRIGQGTGFEVRLINHTICAAHTPGCDSTLFIPVSVNAGSMWWWPLPVAGVLHHNLHNRLAHQLKSPVFDSNGRAAVAPSQST
jgi:hypothetical protein